MNVLYTSNEHKGILITCPHCKFGSRYDGSYIEDAIKIRHDIVCVACGEVFNLVVSIPNSEAVEHGAHPTGGILPPSEPLPAPKQGTGIEYLSHQPTSR